MEPDAQVFAGEGKAIAVVTQQKIVAVAQETVFGDQAEVVGQLDGNTRFQSQFKARLTVPNRYTLFGFKSVSAGGPKIIGKPYKKCFCRVIKVFITRLKL